MQSFGNYNINPNPPVYVGGGEKRKKKKEEKPSEDIASKIALPIAVTAGAALAICAGVFGVNKALGGGKKVVGETAKKTAGTVKETAKKANKTIQEQQQEISKILKNLQAGQKFTKYEATQLTQYLTAYTSALTLGGYQGINIDNYTKLITNFIRNINEQFKDPSVKETTIAGKGDSLIEDINNINKMFDQIKNLVESQNQMNERNQSIDELDIEVEEEKQDPVVQDPVMQDPVAKLELTEGNYKQNSLLEGLNVQTLSSLDPKHIVCCYIDDIPFLVIDSNGLTLDKTPDEASSVKFDGADTTAYLYKLKDTMPPSDMTTLLDNSKITSALVSQISDNFLQQYLINQAEKVSGAKAKELEAMINLTNKVKETITADEFNETIKAILDANTNLINAIQQQQQLNEKLAAFDADKDSLKLFKNFGELKELISKNYDLEANSIYYIDSNNEWKNVEDEEKVPDNAKFVISVGDETTDDVNGTTTDVTITKKAPYCDLVYDKDGHITVEATPAKKYIDIITAEKHKDLTAPALQCEISDADKETALKNLKDLLTNCKTFMSAYNNKRGIMKAIPHMFLNNDCLEELKKASSVEAATNILKDTEKYSNILSALNAATISTTYADQKALNAAIAATDKTPYLKDILTTNTTSKKLPLFSGDTEIEYTQTLPTTNEDGSTTVVYTSTEKPPKKYKVTCSISNGQNTVTIKLGDKTYAYTVSEAKCELPKNVPEANNKDLFEHFVYMALPDDNKKKAFAHYLLKQIPLTDMVKTKNNQVTEETKALQKKVLRLIMAATDKNSNEYKFAQKLLNKEDVERNRYLFIDNSHNITSGDIKQKPQKCVYIYKRTTSDNTKYTISFYSQGLT